MQQHVEPGLARVLAHNVGGGQVKQRGPELGDLLFEPRHKLVGELLASA